MAFCDELSNASVLMRGGAKQQFRGVEAAANANKILPLQVSSNLSVGPAVPGGNQQAADAFESSAAARSLPAFAEKGGAVRLPPRSFNGLLATCDISNSICSSSSPGAAAEAQRGTEANGDFLNASISPSDATTSSASVLASPAAPVGQGVSASVTSDGLSHVAPSVTASTAASSPSRSPAAALFADVSRSSCTLSGADGNTVIASSLKAINAEPSYLRCGRVLVVCIPPPSRTLGCTYTANETAGHTHPEETSRLALDALQKFRSCFQQSEGVKDGKIIPSSLLLQQLFTTAATVCTRNTYAPATSSADVASAACLSSSSSGELLSSPASTKVPTTFTERNAFFHHASREHPVPPKHSPTCSTSFEYDSAPALQPATCRSVFPQIEEVEALARLPVMKELGMYIRHGGVVAFPTETVYGLGAAATVSAACEKIYTLKRRPATDPLICHVASIEQALDSVFDLGSDDDSDDESARTSSVASASSICVAAKSQPPASVVAPPSSLSTLPQPSVAANSASTASPSLPATCAAGPQVACVGNSSEAAVALDGRIQIETCLVKSVTGVSSSEVSGTSSAASLPSGGGAAAGGGRTMQVMESTRRQQRRDMRLLVKALADAFWPGPLSIVAPGKIIEDRVALSRERTTDHGKTKERGNREEVMGNFRVDMKEKLQAKVEKETQHRTTKGVALAVTSGTRLVAARCPCHKYALALALAAGVPIAAPSANLFGRISPTRAQHVLNQFADPEGAPTPDFSVRTGSSSQQQTSSSTRIGQPDRNSADKKTCASADTTGQDISSIRVEERAEGIAANADVTYAAETRAASGDSGMPLGLPQGPQELRQEGLYYQQQSELWSRNGRRQHSLGPENTFLPLFKGEGFVLLEADDDYGGCCVGIESTVVKVCAVADPADSRTAAALADAEAKEASSSSYYEVQLLRRGIVTVEMLQVALDAAAARHNAAYQHQENQRQQQQQDLAVKSNQGTNLGIQHQHTQRGENVAECNTAGTPFPRFVLTVSPKLQFRALTQQVLKDSFVVSAVSPVNETARKRMQQSRREAFPSEDRHTPCTTASVNEGGTGSARSNASKHELFSAEEPTGAGPAPPPVSNPDASHPSVAAAHIYAGRENEVTTQTAARVGADGTKRTTVAHAGTHAAEGLVTAAKGPVTLEDSGSRDYASLSARREMEQGKEAELNETPLEAPGMALTHYAPCVPCYLVSVAESGIKKVGSGSCSRNSNFLGSSTEFTVDTFEGSTKKLCGRAENTPCTPTVEGFDASDAGRSTTSRSEEHARTIIESKDSILIDAGTDFADFASHFLYYFSLVDVSRDSRGGAAEHGDAAFPADTEGLAVVARDRAAASTATTGICSEVASTRAKAEMQSLQNLTKADPMDGNVLGETAARKRGRRHSRQPIEEIPFSYAWTQAAASSIFETLHAAEAIALKKKARAIFIYAEPLGRGTEHGLAVFDRVYRYNQLCRKMEKRIQAGTCVFCISAENFHYLVQEHEGSTNGVEYFASDRALQSSAVRSASQDLHLLPKSRGPQTRIYETRERRTAGTDTTPSMIGLLQPLVLKPCARPDSFAPRSARSDAEGNLRITGTLRFKWQCDCKLKQILPCILARKEPRSMEVPDEDTAAAQLSSSRSSVGRAKYDTTKRSSVAAKPADTSGTSGAQHEESSPPVETAVESEGAGAASATAETSVSTATSAQEEKKIPPGAVRMLSMTTVAEFQKKVAERKGRMSRQ